MKRLICLALAAAAASAFAGPGKGDAVAEGYPAWTGFDDKSYVSGRFLTPSDMRHKVAVVVEIDPDTPEKAKKQLLAAFPFCIVDSLASLAHNTSWEHFVMPRGVTVMLSNFGGKGSKEAIGACLADKDNAKDFERFRQARVPIYSGVTFPGAPDGTGKRPFVYVMGPEGTTPLFSGPADAKGLAAVRQAVAKAKASLPKWRPFYGPVEEVQHFKSLEQVFNPKRPKPLSPEVMKLKKGIASKDPEVAKEAQLLFDAIEQTKTDLMTRIAIEAYVCPHRAAYDMNELLKYWPTERKNIAKYAERIKATPEVVKLADMFTKVLAWSSPDFECKGSGEAKKILAELTKMKKLLEKFKESENISVQNGALMMDGEVDDLISTMQSRVQAR